jgi:predicted RNA binding protein YcfA (HicA-like mRNA interferase family)
MGKWPAVKANRVLAALLRIGWRVKRETKGSHKTLERAGYPDYTWSFHEQEEIGPAMLARIAKPTGLTPDDL